MLVCVKLLLLLFSLSLVSGFVQGCSSGFMNLGILKKRAKKIPDGGSSQNRLDNGRFRLYDLGFTCGEGVITSLLLGVDITGGTQYPEVQIWDRTENGNDANKQDSRQIRLSRGDFSPNGVLQYNLTTPLEFRNNSMLGVYQPLQSSVRFYYHTVSTQITPSFYESMNNLSTLTEIKQKINATDGFILIHPITDPPDCANGFLDTANLSEAVQAENIHGVIIRDRQQRVFPDISFTCNGSITKWIVGAGTGEGSPPSSELQIWRRSGANSYTKVASTQLTAQPPINNSNVYEYVPSSPLGFREGDILGVYQRENSSVVPYYQESTGPVNLRQRGRVNSAANSLTAPSLNTAINDYPLVTVEIGPPLTRAALPTPFTTEALSTTPSQVSTNTPAIVAAVVLVLVLLVAVFVAGSVVTVVLVVMRSKTSPPRNDCSTKQFDIDNPNYSDERNIQPILELYNTVSAGDYETPPSTLATESNTYHRPVAHLKSTNVWSTVVPTMSQRKVYFSNSQNRHLVKEDIYSKIAQDNYQLYQTTAYHYFEESQAYWEPGSDCESIYEQFAIKKYREINRQHIKINAHLGSGQFGYVNKGVWLSIEGPVDVAVKTLKVEASEEEIVKFLQEAAINGQFHHPNIVKLHGVVTVGEPVMIVLELAKNGDLREYLQKLRPIPGEMAPPSLPQQLLGYCRQIASGMEYLSKKSFVHRDLAARNILVDDETTCKIADFGMSRDLSDSDYYVSRGGKIPIKWTAPEAVLYKKYSTSSDVWSFGVLMYEIWSLGHKPFDGKTNPEVVRLIDTGYRLPPPPGCPRVVYQLMIDCWHPEASGRLSFGIVVSRLSQPENQLLKWADRDKSVTHPQSTMLGAPLETASANLHTDLQQQYM